MNHPDMDRLMDERRAACVAMEERTGERWLLGSGYSAQKLHWPTTVGGELRSRCTGRVRLDVARTENHDEEFGKGAHPLCGSCVNEVEGRPNRALMERRR